MRRPHVVQVITSLDVGGAERVVLDLSSSLIDRGLCVTVVCIGGNSAILEQEYDSRIRIVQLGAGWKPRQLLGAAWRFTRVVAELNPSIVHAHMFHGLIAALIWRIRRRDLRIVFTSHSSSVARWRRLIVHLTRGIRSCDIIFSSDQHTDINAQRVEVIPNGTKLALRTAPRDGKVVGSRWILVSVGRLLPPKTPLELVNAMARLGRSDVELWFVGDGELRGEIENVATQLGLRSQISLLGVRADIPDILDRAHLLLLSSLREGMPLAVLEAGARGLPVLATPVGSVPELLADRCGYVAESVDFAANIETIIENYTEALTRGSRFQRRVIERYSLDSMVKAHLLLYSSLLTSPS